MSTLIRVDIFRSSNKSIRRLEEDILKPLIEQKKIEINSETQTPSFVEDLLDLPAIHTGDGRRFLGVRGLKKFAESVS